MLTVTMRDENMRPRGQIRCTTATLVIRNNALDTFTVQISPEDHSKAKRIKTGWGLIFKDGSLQLSGPITKMTRSMSDGLLTITYAGSSDLIMLQDRLTYPDPLNTADLQNDAYYMISGPAETVIKDLVNKNAGPGAIKRRITTGLTIANDQGRGSQVSANTRFKPLLDEAGTLASQGGLVLTCTQQKAGVVFDVRPVADKSRRIRLSSISDELTSWEATSTAPTVTAPIVGGQGEGEKRMIYTKISNTGWGGRMTEAFKDQRDKDNVRDLWASSDEFLADGQEENKASFTVMDSPYRTFGEDYQVGDIITAVVAPGISFTEQISSATVTYKDGIRDVDLVIGNSDDDKVTSVERRKINQLTKSLLSTQTI